jgi:hypothetical protein
VTLHATSDSQSPSSTVVSIRRNARHKQALALPAALRLLGQIFPTTPEWPRSLREPPRLRWSLTGTDAVVLDPASVVTPYEDQSKPTEVRTGGTVEWQVPFDADPALVTGGLLTVASWTGTADEYVDFQI